MGWPHEAFLYLRQITTPKSRPQPGGNLLYAKSDNTLYLMDADGTEHTVGIQAVVAGSNISVDTTNPARPVISTSVSLTAAQLFPLTTVIGGVPDFVWDADNQLVYTEAP